MPSDTQLDDVHDEAMLEESRRHICASQFGGLDISGDDTPVCSPGSWGGISPQNGGSSVSDQDSDILMHETRSTSASPVSSPGQ